jgi:hypothetical protein
MGKIEETPVREALRLAAQELAATSDTARLDAEVLMAHALGCSRTDVLLRHMADPAPATFAPSSPAAPRTSRSPTSSAPRNSTGWTSSSARLC